MRNSSTVRCALARFCVPLFLVVTFCYANSAAATTEVSGNEVNTEGKLVNEELALTNSEDHGEDAKFKTFFKKPFFEKPFFKKPIPKPFPIVKKPLPIPVVKPIPKPIPIFKPIPKPIPFVKKPFPIPKKPFFPPVAHAVESESFLKPKPFFKKPFFKKPIPKIPLPKFKKPLLPPLPIHKPIPQP